MRVSVILPAFESVEVCSAAVGTLAAQTRPPAEILLVGPQSRNAAVRCSQLPADSPAAAFNTGAGNATGDLLAFLDPRDFWASDHLSTATDELARHPAKGLFQCLSQDFRRDPDPGFLNVASPPYLFAHLGSCVVRREIFEEVGPFDIDLESAFTTDWFIRSWSRGIGKVVRPRVAHLFQPGAGADRRASPSGYYRLHLPGWGQPEIARLIARHLARRRRGSTGSGPRGDLAAYIGGPAAPETGWPTEAQLTPGVQLEVESTG